jgi:hypothetical protein
MTKKNIQCSLAGLGRMTVLWAQGRHRFNSVTNSGRHGLREDDCIAGPGMVRVIGVVGLGTERGAQRCGLGKDDVVVGSGTASQAWGQGLCG